MGSHHIEVEEKYLSLRSKLTPLIQPLPNSYIWRLFPAYIEASVLLELLKGFEKLAISFELDLQEQVSFIRTMNAELLKRFQDTRKKIENMEFDPDPMVSTRFLEKRPEDR